MTYQPTGIKDWSIVGIVEAKAVSSFMFQVQYSTILLIGIMFICVILLIFMYVMKNTRLKLQKEKLTVMAVSHEKEISDMLLNCLARIVDRYALCDIEMIRTNIMRDWLGSFILSVAAIVTWWSQYQTGTR